MVDQDSLVGQFGMSRIHCGPMVTAVEVEVRDFLWWGFVEFPTVEVGEHCPGGEGGGGENFIKDFANESVKVEFSPLS